MLVVSPQAQASIVGFQGPYDPANWTLTTNGGNGSVDTSGAPASVILAGSNTGSFSQIFTDFTTLAVGDGLVSFSWNYETFDTGPNWDPFGYLLDGVFTQLTDDSGAQTQSGSASFSVLAGQTFGFRVNSVDDTSGRAQSTISSFEAPSAAIPEPGTWAAAALLAGGAAFMRWRKRHRPGGDDLEGSKGQERTLLTGTRLVR
jgi:hypothetical protein